MARRSATGLVEVSSRGQLTLPVAVRKQAGVGAGDRLLASVEDGRIVLAPALVLPLERYSEDRIREFDRAARLTPLEMKKARRKWRV